MEEYLDELLDFKVCEFEYDMDKLNSMEPLPEMDSDFYDLFGNNPDFFEEEITATVPVSPVRVSEEEVLQRVEKRKREHDFCGPDKKARKFEEVEEDESVDLVLIQAHDDLEEDFSRLSLPVTMKRLDSVLSRNFRSVELGTRIGSRIPRQRVESERVRTEEVQSFVRASTKRGTLENVLSSEVLTLRLNSHKTKNHVFERSGISSKFFNSKNFRISNNYRMEWVRASEVLKYLESNEILPLPKKTQLQVRMERTKHGLVKDKKLECGEGEVVIVVRKVKTNKKEGMYQEHLCLLMPRVDESKVMYLVTAETVVEDIRTGEIVKTYESKFVFRKNGNKTGRFAENFNRKIDYLECATYEMKPVKTLQLF